MFGNRTTLPKAIGLASEIMNEPGAPPPRFLLVLTSPSVMAPGRPNCAWVHDAQVSVTVAPSSRFCALATETPSVVMQTKTSRKSARFMGWVLKRNLGVV